MIKIIFLLTGIGSNPQTLPTSGHEIVDASAWCSSVVFAITLEISSST